MIEFASKKTARRNPEAVLASMTWRVACDLAAEHVDMLSDGTRDLDVRTIAKIFHAALVLDADVACVDLESYLSLTTQLGKKLITRIVDIYTAVDETTLGYDDDWEREIANELAQRA